VASIESALKDVEMANSNLSKSTYFSLMSTIHGGGASRVREDRGSAIVPNGKINTPTSESLEKKSPNKIAGSMEQAEILRVELERIKSGMRLLGQSIDRLDKTLELSNKKACGGFFDAIWICCRTQEVTSQGYSTVDMDDSHHPNTPLTRSSGGSAGEGNSLGNVRGVAGHKGRREDDGL
jgi:hypothetical protein